MSEICGPTMTLAVDEATPLIPVHVIIKVSFRVRLLTTSLPDRVFEPDQSPEAIHDVASVEIHVRVVDCPYGTFVGFAFNVTVGANGTTFTVLVTGIAAKPFESETLYVIVYVPTTAVFTVPVVTMLGVIFPSSGSRAVAPGYQVSLLLN